MKNILVLGGMSLIAWMVISLQQAMFPPPPAEYKVVYLGSPNCGACKYWKSSLLPAWKRDPASSYAKLEIAQLRGSPFTGGYGRHDPVFREAFKNKRTIMWPSFVLYSRGEIERVYRGVDGWEKIEKRVRAEAKRMEKRAQKSAMQSAPSSASSVG
ncbi:MAG: hypothetical protein AAFR82_10470 [Pseudomonadota bacterium]